MHAVDPSRQDLAREYKANPIGPHSPELQKLLKLLRWEPVAGRFLVVRPRHDGLWYLARTTGPKGHPLEIFNRHGYSTLPEAHWALFRKRWEQHTGQALILGEDDRIDPTQAGGERTLNASHKPVLGYADAFSVANGETISFKISSRQNAPYHAEIVRLRCADHSGIGLKQTTIDTPINGEYAGRFQPTYAGSYAEIEGADAFHETTGGLTMQVYIWPTTPHKGPQAIMGTWDAAIT